MEKKKKHLPDPKNNKLGTGKGKKGARNAGSHRKEGTGGFPGGEGGLGSSCRGGDEECPCGGWTSVPSRLCPGDHELGGGMGRGQGISRMK